MAQKKDIRKDNTYLISKDTTDNPKLGAKILSDGRESLFLDYYLGYEMVYSEKLDKMVAKKDRKREFLSLYLWQAPRTPIERQQNKETIELAKKIRYERGQELLESVEGYRIKKEKEINFLDYFQAYINKYKKQDKRVIEQSFRWFLDFLKDTPEYNKYSRRLSTTQLKKELMQDFVYYITQRSSTSDGARSVLQRFKKVVLDAISKGKLQNNPMEGLSIKSDGKINKEVLSVKELEQLIKTHYQGENQDIRNAFIFCIYTGLRFGDVEKLTYRNVDFSNKRVIYLQNKTGKQMYTPLTDFLFKLIGAPKNNNLDTLIFNLPTNNGCNKALKKWCNKANISKHITWHCARHSYATLSLSSNDVNISTLMNLLGHSDLSMTQKYLHIVEEEKRRAMNVIPVFEL